jgi:hypothetical protein
LQGRFALAQVDQPLPGGQILRRGVHTGARNGVSAFSLITSASAQLLISSGPTRKTVARAVEALFQCFHQAAVEGVLLWPRSGEGSYQGFLQTE